jgi:predicted acyl esterase
MSLESSMGRFGRRWGLLTVLACLLAGIANAQAQDSSTGQMRIDKDVDIPMSDGLVLKANVYRPAAEGKYPVLVTLSAYGKDNLWARYFPQAFEEELRLYPDLCRNGSSCKYLLFEAPDPERWVPKGYVIVNVDTRGAAKSPGYLNPWSQQEARDYYEAIEWAGVQPWSNGKIGLLGISYYAMVQWMVAALQPPHLAAILPWEGTEDFYREWVFHGGIYTNVMLRDIVYGPAIVRTQHGNPAYVDPVTGEHGGGPITLSPELLAGNRIDLPGEAAKHFLDDEWMRARRPDLSRIKVPLLSAGNWGGLAQHLRGNTEGFMGATSQEKWLIMHTGTHFEKFYIPESVALQMRFFDHYLKGIDNGWEKEPRVQLAIRRPGGESLRKENEWPIARTKWTKFYLNAQDKSLGLQNPAAESTVSYEALAGNGVEFTTAPFQQETEITGPVAAHLWVSSSTDDMDIFATIRAFGPDGKEVTFRGANDPAVPVTQGWLRVSHRKLDPVRSKPYRPWHPHDEVQKLTPGELYAVDVEIWPTSMVFPKGYRLTVVLGGKDFERPIPASGAYKGMNSPVTYRGSGAFLHNERGPVEFGGTNRIISGGQHESYLLLPVIPPQ